jgi:hypothetical protein
MGTDKQLTEKDLEQLHTRGYIKVRAFDAEEAAEMESTIWSRLEKQGVLQNAPSTDFGQSISRFTRLAIISGRQSLPRI